MEATFEHEAWPWLTCVLMTELMMYCLGRRCEDIVTAPIDDAIRALVCNAVGGWLLNAKYQRMGLDTIDDE